MEVAVDQPENTPEQQIAYLFDQVMDLRSERSVLVALLSALIQTHPEREKLSELFEGHVEGMIARALARAEYPESHFAAIEAMRSTFRKVFERPAPPSR
ncbi:hypothetical protein BJL96_11810 [Burkholderia cenocepacia]|nr:hypothetical protein [Burkholderia cenocepacia]